jgi:hypothetical protein
MTEKSKSFFHYFVLGNNIGFFVLTLPLFHWHGEMHQYALVMAEDYSAGLLLELGTNHKVSTKLMFLS